MIRYPEAREECRKVAVVVDAKRWEVGTVVRVDTQDIRELYEGSIEELGVTTTSYYIIIDQGPEIELVIIFACDGFQNCIQLRSRK